MADEKEMKQAKSVFKTLCDTLDDRKWHYKKDEEELGIECSVRGEDIPIDLVVKIKPKSSIVLLYSHLPFIVPKEKRVEFAAAISHLNYMIVDGSFDYDIRDGHVFFRMTTSYLESLVSKDVFNYLISCSIGTIDDYNDKLLMLAKGIITLKQFIESK